MSADRTLVLEYEGVGHTQALTEGQVRGLLAQLEKEPQTRAVRETVEALRGWLEADE